MLGELPVFTRCCCCLPLRYGLIVWGYFRLTVGVLLLVGVAREFQDVLRLAKTEPDIISYKLYALMFGFFLLLVLADIVLNILFVIGGHKKKLRLLKAYYIYSFIVWILIILIGIAVTSYCVYLIRVHELNWSHSWLLLQFLAIFLAEIFTEAYVLLLIRSEIIKITKNYEFKLVNKAAESECNMKCEGDNINIVNEDKEAYNDGTSEANVDNL